MYNNLKQSLFFNRLLIKKELNVYKYYVHLQENKTDLFHASKLPIHTQLQKYLRS